MNTNTNSIATAGSLGSRLQPLQVECDLGLDEAMPLRQAHDVGESLQRRLEALEDVETGRLPVLPPQSQC